MRINENNLIKPVAPIEKTKRVEWEGQELDEINPDEEDEKKQKKNSEPEKEEGRIIDIRI